MQLEVIILAAGQGSRMRSHLPKVLHSLAGRPLLQHVLDTAKALEPVAIHVVVGHGAQQLKEALASEPVSWVEQEQQLGTGHAVLQALPRIAEGSTVLVLYGDVPLINVATLQTLVAQAAEVPALLTVNLANPAGYGRIMRDGSGALVGVVEHKDANADQLLLSEVNSGVMAAPVSILQRFLPAVGNDNQQAEYYLPEVLSLAVAAGMSVKTSMADDEWEVMGVNDQLQLSQLERELQQRRARSLLLAGVRLADPARIDVRGKLECGRDVFIDINCVFIGDVVLGDDVQVGPNCVLRDVTVGNGTEIQAMSHLQQAKIGNDCAVGPYARLRPDTVLADRARVGNFVETKKANIGIGSKVNHLSYIGDCEIGASANIGAGTITCNYDGVNKHQTRIGDDAFVGSNATLVAPVEVANRGFVAAGSTITSHVAEGELAVGRGKQRNIQGWKRPGKPPTSKD
ncbi:UDP-N-acetylglucosamine diphosphorylase/glucosamine-1-phosphate N-acetyltransferase [Kineobactrum sediminis]|uniref:Bifunctional protein GlmU n=1 Tax=Kineobactrum sediminis TaxID=1905677 RepID=A0A2N5Y4X1_9GAMM|nr:bifunctional UDP-N-acetylglucosamine diphosphorylase/glucosamine-1-phosphate N-acetyltransferase GlmU [Kineobactrum sediminis]PLW83456.1 UDP-N-acetylglucosamine diphosphorylase/glucosamine-1-phosphate N-acetyltransferase [Kineobactrum sediminis]